MGRATLFLLRKISANGGGGRKKLEVAAFLRRHVRYFRVVIIALVTRLLYPRSWLSLIGPNFCIFVLSQYQDG